MLFGHSILAAARGVARDVETLLLPAACVACERPLPPDGAGLVCCVLCRARLRPIPPPLCGRCGQPLDRWERLGRDSEAGRAGHVIRAPDSRCGFCRAWPDALEWAASAVWMEPGPARSLIHAVKYGGWRCAARPMAEVMARHLAPRLGDLDLLVPVPLGPTRRRERGHNQAAELATALARTVRVPPAEDALVRRRDTRTQTALAPAERRRNVAGAFAAGGRSVRGLRVALVDDVLTTGATLGAAAAALAAAGAAAVGAITFARALVPS